MVLTKEEKYVLIETKDEVLTAESIDKMRERFYEKYERENIIILLPTVKEMTEKTFDRLSFWNTETRNINKTFVIASLIEELGNDIPEIEQTHTLSEAQDIIFMEEVERDIDRHFEENT